MVALVERLASAGPGSPGRAARMPPGRRTTPRPLRRPPPARTRRWHERAPERLPE